MTFLGRERVSVVEQNYDDEVEKERIYAVCPITTSTCLSVDCEDLLNLPIAERIVLVQGRHGFLGNSEQERPWFSYNDGELLKSKELLKVQEDAQMVSSDEEWNPDSDAGVYQKVLLSDMEQLM